jgi:DNA-binding transcriptional regulator PaaX
MPSSRTAALFATMELFGLIKRSNRSESFIFRTYSQMALNDISRSGYHKRLRRFEKHGLVKKKKTAQGHVFEITPKAKFLRKKAVTKQSRTDGLSTLVIFDIPEEKHSARDTLRRFLIRSGYTQIRESCFLSPFQISTDLRELIDELKLKSNISVFSAKMNLL